MKKRRGSASIYVTVGLISISLLTLFSSSFYIRQTLSIVSYKETNNEILLNVESLKNELVQKIKTLDIDSFAGSSNDLEYEIERLTYTLPSFSLNDDAIFLKDKSHISVSSSIDDETIQKQNGLGYLFFSFEDNCTIQLDDEPIKYSIGNIENNLYYFVDNSDSNVSKYTLSNKSGPIYYYSNEFLSIDGSNSEYQLYRIKIKGDKDYNFAILKTREEIVELLAI